MISHIRIALRRLAKSPGFTGTALATLALCIGANLTIFAVVDAILIHALPFPDEDRLVNIYYSYPKLPSAQSGASLTNYYERRGKMPAFSSLAEIGEGTSVVGETGSTAIEQLGRVTPEFFDTLGTAPLLGRNFSDAEMTYLTDNVVILSHEYWRSHFSSNPAVLGKSIRIDGIPRAVIGVLAPQFKFLSFQGAMYMPLSSEERERNVSARHSTGKILIGRLAPGATLVQARAQMAAYDAKIAPDFPDAALVTQAGCVTVIAPLRADYVALVRPTLILLQAGALFLLVIGGVNLVNLLLIRASQRSRELTIRQALGAGQRHIVADVMVETMVLTLTGGLLGLFVGAAGIRMLGAFGAQQLPLGSEIAFNGRLAVAALLGAFVSAIAIGAPVSIFSVRSALVGALQAQSRSSTTGRATRRMRNGFIVAQISLAFVLVTGAGLLGLSLKQAMGVSPGFRPDHVITGQFGLSWAGYHDQPKIDHLFDTLYEKTRSLPGVEAAGAISNVPVVGARDRSLMVVLGSSQKQEGSLAHAFDCFGVSGDYFQAMGIPLISGRYLTQADAHASTFYAVVDETFARYFWPKGNAVGSRFYQGSETRHSDQAYTVVGVVGTVKQAGLAASKPDAGAAYFTFNGIFFRNYFLVARTSLPPEAIAATLEKVVRSVDADIPLTDVSSMDVRITDSLATRRSPALMAGIFGLTALLLATIGLYGVMAYTVVQRTREFGVRLALGAQRVDVLRLVFMEGARLAALGLAVGVAISWIVSSFMGAFLFGVKVHDPWTYVGVSALLAAVAAAACLVPARRATHVDPMEALRCD